MGMDERNITGVPDAAKCVRTRALAEAQIVARTKHIFIALYYSAVASSLALASHLTLARTLHVDGEAFVAAYLSS
jgi:hypothetical protein